MPLTKRTMNYSLLSIEEMQRMEKHGETLMNNQEMLKQLTYMTDTVLKYLVYYHHFIIS